MRETTEQLREAMRLKDRVALVTGGDRGLGLGIARAFAREGARVCIANPHADAGEAAARRIVEDGGLAMAVAMDVTDEGQVEAGVARTVERWGGLDILVSNAGVQHIEPLSTLALADWRRLLAVHLDGAFLTSRAALRIMSASGRGGSIILMGSVMSVSSALLKSPYVTAKHGLAGLCQVIAREGAEHGVRCNIIEPGFVRTDLVEQQLPEQARALGLSEDEVVRRVMLGGTVDAQFTTVEDVAEVAVFFAAFPSNALTGQSLAVSHGWGMH
jgi:3-hydroxybutyrate dehydrogenase